MNQVAGDIINGELESGWYRTEGIMKLSMIAKSKMQIITKETWNMVTKS